MFSKMLGVLLMMCASAWGSEPPHGCFKSIAEAVAVTHAFPGSVQVGFRVEDLRADVLHGSHWAAVRSCEHPEWPALAVPVAGEVTVRKEAGATAKALIVRAGVEVRLVRTEANARLEMRGVTQSNGGLGERIAVRVLRASDDGGVQMVMAVVRSADVLEMEP